jgi:uncharacterized SAM-binding protein YcdF (DUF218 family)
VNHTAYAPDSHSSPWLRALTGASIGLLAAATYRAGGLPTPPGSHTFILPSAAVGALVGLFVPTRATAYAAVVLAAVTALVTLTPILHRPVQSWIRRDPIPATPLDAVVTLSSAVNPDGVIDAVGTDRLLSALELVRRNHAKLLITSRVTTGGSARPVTSDADQRALIALAGDTSQWRVISPVASTRDEAVRTAALLAPADSHRIAVVTSALHTRRACETFEAVGFHVVCVPSAERRYPVYSLEGSRARFNALFEYLYELAAMVKYRAHGWLPR